MRKPDQVNSILWAIALRGPDAAFDYVEQIKYYRKTEYTTYMRIRQALDDAGMARTDMMELVMERHATACACWPCVMGLQMKVLQQIALMQARELMRADGLRRIVKESAT